MQTDSAGTPGTAGWGLRPGIRRDPAQPPSSPCASSSAGGSAFARASAILSKGFPGVMRLESNGLFKVQAGPFANGEEADRAAGRVLAELGIKAYKVVGEAPAVIAAAPATASAAPATPAR